MKKNPMWTLLFNPFTKIAGWKALLGGMVFVLCSGIVGAYANVAFDGVIDAHFSSTPLKMSDAFIFLAIDIVSVTGIFYLLGLIISKRLRFIDVLGTTTFARAPLTLFALAGLWVTPVSPTELTSDPMVILQHPGYIIFSLLALPLLAWYVALLYHAYKVSSGAKGVPLVASFIAGLIAAEVLSKLLIHFCFK